jgi:hypothetical protein
MGAIFTLADGRDGFTPAGWLIGAGAWVVARLSVSLALTLIVMIIRRLRRSRRKRGEGKG